MPEALLSGHRAPACQVPSASHPETVAVLLVIHSFLFLLIIILDQVRGFSKP